MHELCHFSLDTYKNSNESFFHQNYLCLPLKGLAAHANVLTVLPTAEV